MSLTADAGVRTGEPGVSLRIPERSRRHGPITRQRLWRLQLAFTALCVVALAPLAFGASHQLKALGLGLMIPGGGLWYAGYAILGLVAILLFAFAFVLWFATGNIVGPPLVWALAAALGVALAGGDVWSWTQIALPAVLVAMLASGSIAGRVRFAAARRRAAELNRELESVVWEVPARFPVMPVRELSEEDLGVQRHLLSQALQPLDQFAGYDWIDQFQTSAVRYQLNFQQYALAMSNLCSTPAFTGYLAEAQRRLIEKMLDPRVWRYWALENLWGYLRWDPNPIPERDNVMLTGYMGTMLGAYEQVSDDRRYSRPGSLTFRWNGEREYPNDFHTIADNVAENLAASAYCLYPCEPNWIYTSCNTMAMCAIQVHDARYGTSLYEGAIEEFRRALEEEFMTADGRLVGIRSARLGFSLPGITSTMADCISAFFIAAPAPDIARRTWEVVRRRFIELCPDGSFAAKASGWDKLDTGNYKPGSDVGVHWAAIAAAREMGDEEVASAAMRATEAKFAPVLLGGQRVYSAASNQANAVLALGRFSRRNGWRDLIANGPPDAGRRGPRLADVPYPDALVARAASDGDALSLTLRPGTGGSRVALQLERLRPHCTYGVRGTVEHAVNADGEGRAVAHADLDGRTEIEITPSA
jgi:hypothetical protein